MELETKYNTKIDIPLFAKIYQRHMYVNKKGFQCDRNKLTQDYLDETGIELNQNSFKHYYKRIDREELWKEKRGNIPTREEKDFGVDHSTNEGLYYSKKYIEIDTEKQMTPEEALMSHGLDPVEWEIMHVGSTGSKIGTKGNDEQYFINTYRSIKARPKMPEDFTDEQWAKLLCEKVEPLEPIEYDVKKTNKAFEVDFFDIHVNSSGYCRKTVMDKVEEMRSYIVNNSIAKVYIVFGGDFLHVNDTNYKTVAGTQLTLVGSAYEMVREAESLATYIIERVSVVESEVLWVLGNHSDLPEYQLFSKLKLKFKLSKHIKFHVDESPYKAYVYGNQFVMVSHGNISINQLRNLPSQRFPLLWSKAKYWEVHLGHIHHENVRAFDSLIVRYQRTPKFTDDWEYYKGWYNSLNHIQAYEIDFKKGITGVFYF